MDFVHPQYAALPPTKKTHSRARCFFDFCLNPPRDPKRKMDTWFARCFFGAKGKAPQKFSQGLAQTSLNIFFALVASWILYMGRPIGFPIAQTSHNKIPPKSTKPHIVLQYKGLNNKALDIIWLHSPWKNKKAQFVLGSFLKKVIIKSFYFNAAYPKPSKEVNWCPFSGVYSGFDCGSREPHPLGFTC